MIGVALPHGRFDDGTFSGLDFGQPFGGVRGRKQQAQAEAVAAQIRQTARVVLALPVVGVGNRAVWVVVDGEHGVSLYTIYVLSVLPKVLPLFELGAPTLVALLVFYADFGLVAVQIHAPAAFFIPIKFAVPIFFGFTQLPVPFGRVGFWV